jgi:ribonuclease P protein component
MKLVLITVQRDFKKDRFNKRFFGRYLKISLCSNSGFLFPRFAIIIPKTILKKATDRNKIRRRIKYYLQKNLTLIRPFDVLFFVTPKIIKTKYQDVSKDIDEIFFKANLWKPQK